MNNHENKKKTIKIVGFVLVAVGGILTAIGLISFFNAFSTLSTPDFFWCAFIGLPLLGTGVSLLTFGYRRETMKYIKDESLPIYKETYYEAKPEINDFISSIKGNGEAIKCPSCGTINDDNHNFCKQCGQSLSKRKCLYCMSEVDEDANFCPKCGKKL